MVSNAESQRTLSNAEIVDLFPLRFSAGGVYPARFWRDVSAMKTTIGFIRNGARKQAVVRT